MTLKLLMTHDYVNLLVTYHCLNYVYRDLIFEVKDLYMHSYLQGVLWDQMKFPMADTLMS